MTRPTWATFLPITVEAGLSESQRADEMTLSRGSTVPGELHNMDFYWGARAVRRVFITDAPGLRFDASFTGVGLSPPPRGKPG